MEIRKLARWSVRFVIALALASLVCSQPGHAQATGPGTSPHWDPSRLATPLLRDPIWVYNDWSAYDELSDNIPLSESLAMKELGEIVRLRGFGVHFDYYMMDAFWFAPEGAYRTWRKPSWPQGPERWIAACRQNGILPGLWFSTNTLVKIDAAPAWRNSLNAKGGSM